MSKTFCIMPFIHQNIKHEGKVSACWRYPDRLGDFRKQSLEEIWNSNDTKELRRSLLNNEMPKGCRSCWDFEKSGVKSTRITCNDLYEKHYKIDTGEVLKLVRDDYSMPYQPKSIEIRFDNTCNFKCRHCSPTYSSQWESAAYKNPELKDFFQKNEVGRLEDKHYSLSPHTFEDFKKAIPYLREVLVAGGEPLQQKRHWEMIEIMEPYAKNITLSYNSNLSSLGINKWNVLEWWPKFKKIILRVSVDGYEDIFSYFRTNGNIEDVISNIQQVKKLNNVNLNITSTICIYNISRLVEIVKFTNKLGAWFHTSLVQYPEAINPKVFPAHIKKIITDKWNNFLLDIDVSDIWGDLEIWKNESNKKSQIEKIKNYGNYVINYMNSQDYSDKLSDTKKYILLLDKENNTNFSEVYPELSEIIL